MSWSQGPPGWERKGITWVSCEPWPTYRKTLTPRARPSSKRAKNERALLSASSSVNVWERCGLTGLRTVTMPLRYLTIYSLWHLPAIGRPSNIGWRDTSKYSGRDRGALTQATGGYPASICHSKEHTRVVVDLVDYLLPHNFTWEIDPRLLPS